MEGKKKSSNILLHETSYQQCGSFAKRNNLMGGVKLILMQLNSQTDYSTAYLVKKLSYIW